MPNFGTCIKIIDIDGSEHTVTRSGLLWAYGDKSSGLPLTLLHDAARIPDFGRNLKRPAEIMRRVQLSGYDYETRYDAAHGRRYMLCAFKREHFVDRMRQRRITIAAAEGILNLRQHQIDCGIPAAELDAMAAKEI